MSRKWILQLTGAVVFSTLFSAGANGAAATDSSIPEKIRFNRDVRPILSDNCFECHGFDKNKRKADLRLDTKEGLLAKLEHGSPVVPGKPAESEIYRRVTAKDPDDVMPPADHRKHLQPRDVEILKRWIEQGGTFEGHWAYIPPVRPAVPNVSRPRFSRNAIDAFILQRLQSEGLTPSTEADRVTLIRRVTFDLTGLPPTSEEVRAFVADTSPNAYEKVVDRLLASPRFGERMAVYWLDLVRYADTIGYHSDNPMNVSPYREWVIEAINANKPFDQFTVEQLAGDLLPNATVEQKVASGYNRLLQTTEEGGAQAKEYLVKNFTDRVRNYSTVWLGATMGCCQCHDHKFDPLATKEFYTMAAFFADVQEAPIGRREPGMPVPSPSQQKQLKAFDDQIAAAKAKMDQPTADLAAAQAAWEKEVQGGGLKVDWQRVDVIAATGGKNGPKLTKSANDILRAEAPKSGFPAKDSYTITMTLPATGVTGLRLEALADPKFPAGGPGVSANGNFVLTEVKAELADKKQDRKTPKRPLKFSRASADYSQDGFKVEHAIDGNPNTGWAVMAEFGKDHAAVFEFDKPVAVAADDQLVLTLEFNSIYPQHQIGKFRITATTSPAPGGADSIPAAVRKVLAIESGKRSDADKSTIAKYYRTIAPALQPVRSEIASLEQKKAELLKTVPTCLVSTSASPRTVQILKRGDWQDDTGPTVEPQVPAVLGSIPTSESKRLTRLELAKWTVDKKNPLTARVFVNREWKLFFGQGLSKVLDDLGFQGEWPTHPELLDWLAVEFMESGWDVKHMVRLLVTSGTYRQTSVATPEQKEKDPYNRLYARQSRFRLDAEMVRDNALATSGLLVEKLGGRSVFPYQPAGYWFALNFPTREWQNDTGDGLYRRGIYTHWQRSFLHPSLLAFDAPSREEATCERSRSNIPQQALVLLNDPTYVEASRVLAAKITQQAGDDLTKIRWGFEHVTSRSPSEAEVRVLSELLEKHRKEYIAEKDAATKLLGVGAAKAPAEIDPAELAAWTNVARTLLNLSETITRY